MGKDAEVVGTSIMPVGAPTYTDRNKSLTKTIPKVGEALPQGEPVSGEQVQRLPQAQPVRLRVDVTAKEAPTLATKKEAQHYALPSQHRYPLDSYAHVKTAAVYFDDNYKHMVPEMRWEYCQNLCKRASALGIEVSPMTRKYGGAGYAGEGDFKIAMMGRWSLLQDDIHKKGLDYLEKERSLMHPQDFAVALSEFDKVAGIDCYYDRDILDPYYSTFGEKRAEEDDAAILVGNDYISADELKRFAKTCSGKLKDMFGEDFVDEFRKDPLAITRSLPADQKKVILRLASSTLTDPTST